MKRVVVVFVFLISPQSFAYPFTLSNFDSPESFQADLEDGSYYVSNVNGELATKDGNGYISKINATGSPVIQKFIGGRSSEALLHGPKGLAVVGKSIYVADIDAVKVFNKITGKLIVAVDLSDLGAKFLNDVTADAWGDVYVSDTMTNQIFKISSAKKYEAVIFKEGKELGGPNGLAINPKTKNLIVVTWTSGQILEIDRSGKIHVLKRGLSTLDGIDYDSQGNLFVSSFEKGEIYKIPKLGRGALTTFLSGLTTPADISYDRKRDDLLIPSFKGNSVMTIHNPAKKNP